MSILFVFQTWHACFVFQHEAKILKGVRIVSLILRTNNWVIKRRIIHCILFQDVTFLLKVIPLFCTAHPLLRITLPHPRWRRFFPLARKEQTRAAFAELKLLFAIIMPQIGWQLPDLLSKNKKMTEMCVIPKSAVVFHFAAVELWNY